MNKRHYEHTLPNIRGSLSNTYLYSQYRGIAVNYNQVVKALNTNFSEKKALAFLYKLEKATMELADLNRQIIELTREFETRWLQR